MQKPPRQQKDATMTMEVEKTLQDDEETLSREGCKGRMAEALQARNLEIADALRATILQDIRTCHDHIVANTEMPQAAFTAGQPHLEQFGYVDIVKMIGLRVVMDDKASRKGAAS